MTAFYADAVIKMNYLLKIGLNDIINAFIFDKHEILEKMLKRHQCLFCMTGMPFADIGFQAFVGQCNKQYYLSYVYFMYACLREN